jgi:hypothetical protein
MRGGSDHEEGWPQSPEVGSIRSFRRLPLDYSSGGHNNRRRPAREKVRLSVGMECYQPGGGHVASPGAMLQAGEAATQNRGVLQVSVDVLQLQDIHATDLQFITGLLPDVVSVVWSYTCIFQDFSLFSCNNEDEAVISQKLACGCLRLAPWKAEPRIRVHVSNCGPVRHYFNVGLTRIVKL